MTETIEQDNENWKRKYYDQLDQLEKKEQHWGNLETILKKTVSRLCLAAEGYNNSIDQHIQQIRSSTRDEIDRIHLETTLNELSRVLARIEESQGSPEKKVTTVLVQLLEALNLPKNLQKQKDKLLKKLNKSTDRDTDQLLVDLSQLFDTIINDVTPSEKKPGLLGRLLTGRQENGDTDSEQAELNHYRSYMLSFIDQLIEPESINNDLLSLKKSAQNAREKIELEHLCTDLAHLLSKTSHPISRDNLNLDGDDENEDEDDDDSSPSIQELLIRLLEQLAVPADLHGAVEQMKERLEIDTSPADWHQLLKDVAHLINSIRSRLQQEKHDFEEFLQQITMRLQEMDSFLRNEGEQIHNSYQEGQRFDGEVDHQVQEIRDDVTQATDLNELKNSVQNRLETISKHIKVYRETEQQRSDDARKSLVDMQEKMVSLEEETENLKQVIVEKNREAMMDVLTEIPNRLAYEKMAHEEIARWKRFEKPLTLAVWDVDLFKNVNDTYGHKAGDKVLKTIAQLLNNRIRETDFLARFGGEEFVMLLPGTNEEETFTLVEQLRIRIQDCGFHYKGHDVKITVSCGISSFQGDDELGDVFERADTALYEAKEKGRNQCIIAS
ncbi:MAG: diguanylate cyclase [Gammaproteobacteria bacterium]|nr:diguanylate cyclase [Gammaproteobacteria bacterium]